MQQLRYIIILLFLLVSQSNVFSQKYVIHNYTEEQGMPNSQVFDIVQDDNDYIFVSSRNKISRYDGYSWKNFSIYEDMNHYGFSRLKRDKKGKIWAFNNFHYLGISYLNGNEWVALDVPKFVNDKYKKLGDDFDIIYENDSNYRFVHSFRYSGFNYIKNGKKIFESCPRCLKDTIINDIKAINNDFWICTQKGISILVGDSVHNEINEKYDFPSKNILAVAQDEFDSLKIWVLGRTFIGYIHEEKLTILKNDLNLYHDFRLKNFAIIPNYYSCVVFTDGLEVYILDKISNKIVTLTKKNGLVDNRPFSILKDRENNLWISFSRGISKVSSLRFTTYNDLNGLLDSEVSAITQDEYGKMLFGHNFGLSFFKDSVIKTQSFETKQDLDLRIMCFVKDSQGKILVTANRLGIGKIVNDEIEWQNYSKIEQNKFSLISKDKNDAILISNGERLFRQTSVNNFELIKEDTSFSMNRLIFVNDNNEIYFTSTNNGVTKIDGGKIRMFQGSRRESNSTFAVFFDYRGKDLVGTLNGLYYIDYQNDSLVKYIQQDFQVNKPIYFIVKDIHDENKIWIGTDGGLISWDGVHKIHYGVREGLAGLECNRGAAYFDTDGNLWIGTNMGVSKYNRNYEFDMNIKPKLRIDSIIGGDEVFHDEIRIDLDNDQNVLGFYLSLLSYIDETENIIEYKLEGFDKEWKTLSEFKSPTILYNYLPDGEYQFKARGINALGVESEYILSPIIKIHMAFYQEAWFIILIILIIVVFLYIIILFANERMYRAKLEIEVSTRTKLLSDSERRYKMMFNGNDAIMLILNPGDGQIIQANPSAKRFYSFSDEKMESLYYDDLIPRESMVNYDVLNYFKNMVYESVHRVANRKLKDVLVYQSIIDTGKNKVTYLIVQDITERKDALEKLKRLNAELENIVDANTIKLKESITGLIQEINDHKVTEDKLNFAKKELEDLLSKEKQLGKLKSRFVAMISHEYRTPLTIVNTSAELIEEAIKRSEFEQTSNFVSKIQKSVEVMTRLLEDVLMFDKIESNEYDNDLSPIKIKRLFQNVRARINSTTNYHENVEYLIENEELEIESDEYLLTLILEKVLSNAVKYTPSNKAISLSVSDDDEALVFIIKDEGKGIARSEIDSIFYPFFKGKNEIGISQGTGLGLALVQKAVQILRGSIDVESRQFEGTTFTIRIPFK
jgi:PAS domain S-box-containing protein